MALLLDQSGNALLDQSGIALTDQDGYPVLALDGVVSAGNWLTNTGGADLHTALDEYVADDTDFIESGNNAVGDVATLTFSNPTTEVSISQPIVIRYRYGKDGIDTVNITVTLKEGANNIIATATHNDVSGTLTDGTITLTPAEKASVSNWDDVLLEIEANVV